MRDAIYRQDAIDALCDNCDNVKAVCAHYPCKQYIAIEQLPSALPERKAGKWIVLDIRDYAQRHTGRKVGKCPFCGYLTGEFRRLLESHHELTNFCPECGAKLEV